MKKGVTIVPWTDFLHYSETIGYSWNQAHDILRKDNVPPMYECRTKQYDIEEMGEGKVGEDAFGWSEDSLKIVYGFMKKNELTEITVIDE